MRGSKSKRLRGKWWQESQARQRQHLERRQDILSFIVGWSIYSLIYVTAVYAITTLLPNRVP